jgi:hypothetical protein
MQSEVWSNHPNSALFSQVGLNLSENALGAAACSEISLAVAQHQHLRSLQLQHCKFSGSEIVTLLSVMHRVTSLTALHLQFNTLTGIPFTTSTTSLSLNTSLIDLRLPPPPPRPDAMQQENRVCMLMQHDYGVQLIERASKLCSRNRAAAAAVEAEALRLSDLAAFIRSIVMEAIASG